MLLPWLGPAETLTKYKQAWGCSRQNGAVKGGILGTQICCREKSRSDATDPVWVATQDLFVGGLSHCLSHRFLPWKKKALTQRVVSRRVTQRWTEHSAPSWQPKQPFLLNQGDRAACTGQRWEQELGTPWAALLLCRDPHSTKLPAGRAPSGDPGGILSLRVSGLVKDQQGPSGHRSALPTAAWDEAHAAPLHSALSPARGRRALKELPFHY